MPTIVKPQVLVFQEFSIVPVEITEPLRAHISGPNAKLHRFEEDDEKALINVGEYDRTDDQCYEWPGREAGSVVDEDSVRLFIDDGLLLYHEDLIGDSSEGRGTVAPVSGRSNWIRSSDLQYKANGTQYPRSGLFNDRDVQVGDRVYVRGVNNDEDDCDEIELWTYVEGFAADEVDAVVFSCSEDSNNAVTTEASATIAKTAGPDNCIEATVDGSLYDGLADGEVCETYTIEVIKSSIAGCQAARLRITTASGTDNQAEVQPEDYGTPTAIGTRGLTVTFDQGAGSCSSEALDDEVTVDELVVGQTWEVDVCQDFEKVCCEHDGDYAGPDNDTYVVEVTKGGTWAQLPEISVTTVKGLDFSGPTNVSGANVAVPIGTWGLAIKFVDCFGSDTSSAASEGDPFGGDSALALGLNKGDKFYISVLSGQNGPIRTLILRDDLPIELDDAADLDLRLFIEKTIEVTENRISHPPLVNYELEETQLCVKAGVTAYDETWTDNGIEQPLTVWSGTQYIEYREWVDELCDKVHFIDDVADIDDIPGPLHEDNPLKWGVFRALQNSGGTRVAYTAVCEPDSLDSWKDVIERVDGRDDVYNFVPLSYNREVLNLFQAHVGSESSPESGNWKAMFVNLQATTAKMVVGQSDEDTQLLTPTSTDGELVLATLADDPEATDTQYTRLRAGNNAGFILHGVKAGDIVRYLYTIDAFGTQSYSEFVVDKVLSNNTLRLLQGHSDPITVAQKIEIWHTLSKDEQIDELKDQAQSWADRRVVATWPDVAGTAGNAQSGYFLNAAVAGLASGVVPHQPLTNVEVAGFDDLASRTKDYFSESQIDFLDDSGVWIVTEDRDGTPHTRHALTTDTLDLNRREEMIRRNVDSISYLFLRRLRPFIGRTNATPSMVRKLEYEVNQVIKFLKTNGFTAELGSQLIDGTIRSIRIHPLAADRIEIVLDLVVPAPLNNIELHLVV